MKKNRCDWQVKKWEHDSKCTECLTKFDKGSRTFIGMMLIFCGCILLISIFKGTELVIPWLSGVGFTMTIMWGMSAIIRHSRYCKRD